MHARRILYAVVPVLLVAGVLCVVWLFSRPVPGDALMSGALPSSLVPVDVHGASVDVQVFPGRWGVSVPPRVSRYAAARVTLSGAPGGSSELLDDVARTATRNGWSVRSSSPSLVVFDTRSIDGFSVKASAAADQGSVVVSVWVVGPE